MPSLLTPFILSSIIFWYISSCTLNLWTETSNQPSHIQCGTVTLRSLFLFKGEESGLWKVKHHNFPLQCVIYFEKVSWCTLLSRARKECTPVVVLNHIYYLIIKIRIFVKYVTNRFFKYKIYICIYSPILENYYNINTLIYERGCEWIPSNLRRSLR